MEQCYTLISLGLTSQLARFKLYLSTIQRKECFILIRIAGIGVNLKLIYRNYLNLHPDYPSNSERAIT
jgi:hypothetical protein